MLKKSPLPFDSVDRNQFIPYEKHQQDLNSILQKAINYLDNIQTIFSIVPAMDCHTNSHRSILWLQKTNICSQNLDYWLNNHVCLRVNGDLNFILKNFN